VTIRTVRMLCARTACSVFENTTSGNYHGAWLHCGVSWLSVHFHISCIKFLYCTPISNKS